MSEAGGFFSVRFFRDDFNAGLFKGWRESAWVDLTRAAHIETGVVRLTVREMALMWETSVGGVERWLSELAETGRYVRMERVGATAREGRRLVVLDVEERNQKRTRKTRNNDWNKDGTIDGTGIGTIKSSNGADNQPPGGTMIGTKIGTKLEHDLEHVIMSIPNEGLTTVPSEPSAPVAPQPDADLFGDSVEVKPQAKAPPKEAPKEPPAEVDAASAVAQKVVALFHDLSKSTGGNGVAQSEWGGQRKIAANAVRSRGIDEESALGALRWGMRDAYWRQRLRAQGLKLFQDVWSAWIEENLGKANGNGRNGTGRTATDGTGAQGAGGGSEVYLSAAGRWERR